MEQPRGGRRRRWGRLAATCLVAGAGLLGPVLPGGSVVRAENETGTGYRAAEVPIGSAPPQNDHLAAARYEREHPDSAPAGTNDFDCVPSERHPRPVVLAHGTDSSVYADWSAIGARLVAAGLCVFAPNYGREAGGQGYGTGDMRISARQVGEFVDRVLAETGARQVDLVGFSQGANVTRYYMNKLGGAAVVGTWVGLASPSYGGVMYGLVPVAQAIPGALEAFALVTSLAAVQQAQGSPFMRELNEGGDTVAGPDYVTVGSRVDEMIQPFENIALRGAGARNLAIQDQCPQDLTGHFHMVYDPYVQDLLLSILDPAGGWEPGCAPVALGTGIPEVVIAGNS